MHRRNNYSSIGHVDISSQQSSVQGWQKIRSNRTINHVPCFLFFMSPFFSLHSVFVAGLRPENMAAVLYSCGGQSQAECQLSHIVVGIKAPSGAVCVQPRCTLGQYRRCKWGSAAREGRIINVQCNLNSATELGRGGGAAAGCTERPPCPFGSHFLLPQRTQHFKEFKKQNNYNDYTIAHNFQEEEQTVLDFVCSHQIRMGGGHCR